MNIIKKIKLLVLTLVLICTTNSYAGNTFIASGEASEEMSEAALQLASASTNLSGASIQLSGDVALTLGRPVAEAILHTAAFSGGAVMFSGSVLADGIVSTARFSSDLTQAGITLSSDAALLAASAAHAGMHISIDTAELFLSQAVNIAAASGRLSGEAAVLAVLLGAAGVELSADSASLVAAAGQAGMTVSQEAAEGLISASLAIAADCIENAVIAEKYILMTLEEANTLLHEASIATIKAGLAAGRNTYAFTAATAAHLHSLGIDSARFARELTSQAAQATSEALVNTVQGANDAIVVVINTGSGLIVASLDDLTETVQYTADRM